MIHTTIGLSCHRALWGRVRRIALSTNLNDSCVRRTGFLLAVGPSYVENRHSRPSSSIVVCFSSLRELPGAARDPIPQGTSAHRVPAASAQGVKVPPAVVP